MLFHTIFTFALGALGATSAALASTRNVVTSPQLAEIFFQVGLGQSVVGTAEYSDYPNDAKAIPRIGPLFQPSVERTLFTQPTRVYVDALATPPAYQEALENLNIATESVTLRAPRELIQFSQKLIKANQPIAKNSWRWVEQCVEGPPESTPKKSFIILVWSDPALAVGKNTFLSHLLESVGGKNLVADSGNQDYPVLSPEWLLSHVPDRVYFLADDDRFLAQVIASGEKWWPRRKVEFLFLANEQFGRSSFTPFLHLEKLKLSPSAACRRGSL